LPKTIAAVLAMVTLVSGAAAQGPGVARSKDAGSTWLTLVERGRPIALPGAPC
jgi:hypothetical protein